MRAISNNFYTREYHQIYVLLKKLDCFKKKKQIQKKCNFV